MVLPTLYSLWYALRSLPSAAFQPRLLAGGLSAAPGSPLRAPSIEFAPVRRNRSDRRVGICRLQPSADLPHLLLLTVDAALSQIIQ